MTNLDVTQRRYRDPNCPGEDCWFCSGDACLMCLGPGWYAPDCEHDVIDRHGGLPRAASAAVPQSGSAGDGESSR